MTAMDGSSQSQGRTAEGNGAEQAIAVQVRGLVKSFGSGETAVTVLKGIDLDVYFGELLLLVGESGEARRPCCRRSPESSILMPATSMCWDPR